MHCTCAKNNSVCTVKCRSINCDNGKLSVQRIKGRKREPPLLTTSLSSQTFLEYLLNSGEERERSWITKLGRFYPGRNTVHYFNSFKSSVTFLYPLKTSENQKFFDFFKGYRYVTLDQNGLKDLNSKVWHWVFKEGSSRMLSKIIVRITREKFARWSRTWKGRLEDFREMVEITHKEILMDQFLSIKWLLRMYLKIC